MADFIGKGRSNTFAVKDLSAFKSEILKYGVRIIELDNGKLVLVATTDDGDFDNDQEEDAPHVNDVIASHLKDGEVFVWHCVGSEGIKYVGGYALAIKSDGDKLQVNLTDIYAKIKDTWNITTNMAAY